MCPSIKQIFKTRVHIPNNDAQTPRNTGVWSFIAFWVILLAGIQTQAHAAVRLPALIGHRMVLQQGQPVPIWGWATPGEPVSVHFAGQIKKTITNAKGQWRITLSPLRPSRARYMEIRGRNRIILRDILVGEVWLCSGQSNMVWSLSGTKHGPAFLRRGLANNPDIRLFYVHNALARKPKNDVRGQWLRSQTSNARSFSGVCYFFGHKLHSKRKVPVGLILSAWGGTRIEAWMSRPSLANHPKFRSIAERQKRWEEVIRPHYVRAYQHRMRQWQAAVKYAKTHKRPLPPRPNLRLAPAIHANSPSALYNAMIHPLHPYAIKGVLWYQGESNVSHARMYHSLFPVMIENWRWLWKQQFPFLFVQIAPFRYRGLPKTAYNELCAAQMMALRETSKTAMVTINDLGNPADIHPRNKKDVAQRLFLAALANAYNTPTVYSGPLYREMRRQQNKLLLSFDHVGGGLVAKGGKLKHFSIAGADRVFHPAQAAIVGDHVMVWSSKVSVPIAVRFAWDDTSIPRLFNAQGFPASTFRTDNW